MKRFTFYALLLCVFSSRGERNNNVPAVYVHACLMARALILRNDHRETQMQLCTPTRG